MNTSLIKEFSHYLLENLAMENNNEIRAEIRRILYEHYDGSSREHMRWAKVGDAYHQLEEEKIEEGSKEQIDPKP